MRHFLPVVVLLLAFFTSPAQSDFRSRQSGDWADSDTWEEFNGSSWQNTASIPDDASGSITIESFMTVSVSSAVTADQVVVLEDALLDILSGGALTILDGSGTDLDIAVGDGFSTFDGNAAVRAGGTLENRGDVSSSATNFSISGNFIHNRNGGAIPPAGWAAGSRLTIRGVTSQAPTGFGVNLSTLEWDCSNQTANLFLDGPLGNFSGDLIITNTNDQRLFLNDAASVSPVISGNFTVGNFADVVVSNSGTVTLNIGGSLTNFGILRLSVGGGSAILNSSADVNSPGDLYGGGSLVFGGGISLRTVAITGLTSGSIDYVIPDDARIDITTSVLGGSGSFSIGDDVILRVGLADANGAFQDNTTGGSIRVDPASRTYGSNLEVIFNGTAAQHIGNAFPSGPDVTLRTGNAAGLSLTNDFDAQGDILLTLGSLRLNGFKLTVHDAVFSGTGYYLIPDEQAVLEILGSGSFGKLPLPAGQQTFKSLIIDRSGGSARVELGSDILIMEDLVLTDGILDLDNYTLELRRDIIAVSGEIETTASSGIHISGTGTLAAIPFRNVNNDLGSFIYERTGTTFSGTDNLTIHDELGLYAGTVDNTSGNISLSDNSRILRRDGDLAGNSPDITAGTYHVLYEGSEKSAGLELPDMSAPDELGNLTVSDGPVTIDRNTVINGSVSIASGSLLVENADLMLRGGSWTNNSGDFTHTGGTLYVESAVTMTGNGSAQFEHVSVTAGNSLDIQDLHMSGNLVIASGSTMTVDGELVLNGSADQQLQVQSAEIPGFTVNKTGGEVFIAEPLLLTGVLNIQSATVVHADGNLVLTTDPADRLAGGSVHVLPAGASVLGEIISEWYQADAAPTGVPMYFGSPVADGVIAGLQDDILVTGTFSGADNGPVDPSLFQYDETVTGTVENGFTAYPLTDDQAPVEPGRGYLAWVMDNSPVTLDLSGQMNQGDISIPVTLTDTGVPASDGWNLVANPFPAAIGWDQLNGWDKTNVRGVIAVYRDGKFRYYNSTGAGQGTSMVMENGIIARHEAFWVQSAASGNLLIGEQAKVIPENVTPPVNPANQMLLTLSDGVNADQALVVVAPGATAAYDAGMDAPKFDNSGMDISTVSEDGTALAMNFLAPLGCGEVIEVAISDVQTGDYTLSINTIEAFDVPYRVTLHDAYLSVEHFVNNQPNYSFSIDENEAATFSDRFTLEFEADPEDLVNENLAYTADNTICPGTTGTVTFPVSQAGVSYQLEINGSAFGSPQTGNGATIFFDLDPAQLQPVNTLRVIATPVECAGPVYLTSEKTITLSDLEPEILYAGGKLASNYTAGNTWYFGDLSNQLSTANEITPTEEGTYILVVNSGGCSVSVSYEYVITSVDGDLDHEISVFPNPATGNYVNIYIDQWNGQDVIVDVLSTNGSLITSELSKTGNLRLNISNWARGVYLLRVHTGSDVFVSRFIRK